MKTLAHVCGMILLTGLPVSAHAGDAKKPPAENKKPPAEDKDPLAKFKEEDLIKIDFCFNKFCECIASKDAKTAAAFLDEMPKWAAKLDLNKPKDKEEFLKYFDRYGGRTATGSQKMAIGGLGEVTYTDKDGKEQKLRMQRSGGMWKLVF